MAGSVLKVPKDVQEAFYRVVHDRDVADLAAQMGMSPGVLYNKSSRNDNDNNHNKPTLADCIILTNLTRDMRIVQAFAHSVGGVFHELPDLSHLSTDALLMQILKIEQEGGDFYRVINSSLEKDNRISKGEYASIEHEAHEFIAAILEGLARMREMSGGDR